MTAALLALALLVACSPTPGPAVRAPTTATTVAPPMVIPLDTAGTDRLQRHHRLARVLPHATARYRVDFSVGADGRLSLVVTLLAVLNDARDLGGYQAELRATAAEALAFVEAQGDDPSTYTVTYRPDVGQPTS